MVGFMKQRVMMVLAMGVLSACETLPSSQAPAQPSPVPDGQIGPAKTDQGECGIYVWGAGEARPFVMHISAGLQTARWASPEGEIVLTAGQIDRSADQISGTFSGANYNAVSLSLTRAKPVAAGRSFTSGQIKHRDAEGWDRIVPVVGLDNCP